MSIGQTRNHAKFCGDLTRNVQDIRDKKICAPEKVGQNSPKSIKTCYPLKPHHAIFYQIGETTLEKALQILFTPFNILTP